MNIPLTYRPKSPGTNIGEYRYFFNGQEADNEVFGEMADFGYEFRQYDSRLARWWSVDPKWNEYPSVSPFVFCNGSPIMMMDLKGEEAWEPDGKGCWIAQQGDNAWTLHKDAGISYEKAKDLMKEQGFIFTNNDQKVNVQIGDRVQVPNYTNSKYDIPYKQPASGRIDYSPINVEDIVFLGKTVMTSIVKKASSKFATNIFNKRVTGYTRHGTEQAFKRGFSQPDVMNIVVKGKKIEKTGRYGSQIHYKLGENTVVTNKQGKIITVFSSAKDKGGIFIP